MLNVKLRVREVGRNKDYPHSDGAVIRKRSRCLQKCAVVIKKGTQTGKSKSKPDVTDGLV